MAVEDSALPGTPGSRLSSVWEALSPSERAALLPHLIGGSPADWLARTLSEHGHRIGATSIKDYRRALREEGVQL